MSHSSLVSGARRPSRQGLTLLELVVVLTILVALGGILVPVLGNFLTRSHVATCATNINELSKSVLQFNAEKGAYPDRWQTGIAGVNIPVDTMWQGQPDVAAGEVINNAVHNQTGIQTDVLDGDDIAALAAARITTVYDHGAATDVTFSIDATDRPLTVGEALIFLTNEQAIAINLPGNAAATPNTIAAQRYVWLGMGPECTLFGQGALEAPAHFSDVETLRADRAYSRFGSVFQLANDAGVALSTAKFKRITFNLEGTADGFETAENHIKVFYEEVRN